MKEEKLPKIDDVAKKARVSISTVSRVINELPTVKEENRQRVLDIIKKLNYKPNVNARRLAGARNYTLGLVMPYFEEMFSSYYVMQVIKGVEEAANIEGWDVLLRINRKNESEEEFYNRVLNNTYVEGVIYTGPKESLPRLEAADIPYVILNMHTEEPYVNCIGIDSEEGAFKMVEYLIKLGHKKIAIITGSSDVQSAQDRLKGYYKALEKHGLLQETPDSFIVNGNFHKMTAYKAALVLLLSDLRPTAIFAASDDMALGALKAVKEQGLRVPQDIALAGFDNNPIAAEVEPPLTTVNQPIAEMGHLAVKMLCKIIAKEERLPVKMLLKPELVIRGSCGAKTLE